MASQEEELNKPIAETTKEDLSYDLLENDDSDEFESIDPPQLNDEDEGRTVLPVGRRRRNLQTKTSPSPQTTKQERTLTDDIAHLTKDEDHLILSMTPDDNRGPGSINSSVPSDMLISMIPGQSRGLEDTLQSSIQPSQYCNKDIVTTADEETAQEAMRARIDSASADDREYEDEDVHSTTWANHRKHVFIVSTSGKPIYSRYGKEEQLVNLFGIIQALVSIVQDDKDNLKCITTSSHKIVFLNKTPLIFVCASRSKLSDHQLKMQLSYAYFQILSVLTNTQLKQIYEHSPGFDLRYLLQGSEKFIDNILNITDNDPSYLLSGVRCLPMSIQLRQAITNTLLQCRTKDVLFAVLIAKDKLISFIKPKEHNLHPIDIHLIFNLVMASTSFCSAESWTPICLPKFDDSGFLHAYISYLPENSPACLLLISTNKEKFFDLKLCKERIVERLTKQGLIEQITAAIKGGNYKMSVVLDAPEIRHYLYRSRKSLSTTSPELPPIYSEEDDRIRLFDYYMLMNQRLHSHAWPTKILYHVGIKEALLGWRTANFDLYIVFDPLISKTQAISLGNKLIRWINKEEERLVITSTTTF